MAVPNYKIPFVVCERFRSGNPEAFSESFQPLDIRLGLEQVQDTPEFREQAERRWKGAAEGDIYPIDEYAVRNFLEVSPRHNSYATSDVMPALMMIIDDEHFIDSCKARWDYFDENPPEPKTHFQEGFDISAMPEGPMTA